MATPEEMAATMLRNLAEKTGKSLSDWRSREASMQWSAIVFVSKASMMLTNSSVIGL